MEIVGETDKHLPLFSDTTFKQRPAPLSVLQGLMGGYVLIVFFVKTGFQIRAGLLRPVKVEVEVPTLCVEFDICTPAPLIR
jgi:hypothetical protein